MYSFFCKSRLWARAQLYLSFSYNMTVLVSVFEINLSHTHYTELWNSPLFCCSSLFVHWNIEQGYSCTGRAAINTTPTDTLLMSRAVGLPNLIKKPGKWVESPSSAIFYPHLPGGWLLMSGSAFLKVNWSVFSAESGCCLHATSDHELP